MTLPTNVIAVDFETKGGGNFGKLERVYGLSWATDEGSGWIPLNWVPSASTGELPQQETTLGMGTPQSVLDIVGDRIPVWHNASFDVRIAREMGWEWGTTDYLDTLLLGYAVNPNISEVHQKGMKSAKYSLDAWGVRLKFPKMQHPKWEVWSTQPNFMNDLIPYAINDAELTLKLYHYLRPHLDRDKEALKHYYSVMLPFVEVIIEMSSVGFFIDNDALIELTDECAIAADEALEACREIVPLAPNGDLKRWVKKRDDIASEVPALGCYQYVGEQEVKGRTMYAYRQWVPFTATDAQIVWALSTLYGWEPKEFTETGKPKVSADVLRTLDYPLVESLATLAEVEKMLSTYCSPFAQLQDEYGFVTCSWNQCVTKTGRLSSSAPNLQNLPTRTELGGKFRKVIAAPPGHKLVGIDLAAIEYRVMAALQADFFLEDTGEVPEDANFIVNIFKSQYMASTPEEKEEYDVHTKMAELWGVPRKVGKNISFGRMFGFGNAKAAKMIGCTTEEAKALVDKANAMNPSFKQFQQSIWDTFEQNDGIGHTLFGRRLVYFDMVLNRYSKRDQTLPTGQVVPAEDVSWRKAAAQRQCFNARIQGTAADIMQILTLEVIQGGWALGARLMASVHDELIFVVEEEYSDALRCYLNSKFDSLTMLPMGVPVVGEAQVGNNWYELK